MCLVLGSATTPTLAFSQRKVREINDPILQILHQLHKIIYITQLPPTLSPNPRRRIIGRYKRVLFAPGSSSLNLKNEMKKVCICIILIIMMMMIIIINNRKTQMYAHTHATVVWESRKALVSTSVLFSQFPYATIQWWKWTLIELHTFIMIT